MKPQDETGVSGKPPDDGEGDSGQQREETSGEEQSDAGSAEQADAAVEEEAIPSEG